MHRRKKFRLPDFAFQAGRGGIGLLGGAVLAVIGFCGSTCSCDSDIPLKTSKSVAFAQRKGQMLRTFSSRTSTPMLRSQSLQHTSKQGGWGWAVWKSGPCNDCPFCL